MGSRGDGTGSVETHRTSHNTPEEAEDFGREWRRSRGDETNAATQSRLHCLEHNLVPHAVFADDSPVTKNNNVCKVSSWMLTRHK